MDPHDSGIEGDYKIELRIYELSIVTANVITFHLVLKAYNRCEHCDS
jgi:hypothetical protein